MSYEAALDQFVNPMRRRFTIPTGIEQKAFLSDMAESLSSFSASQLQAAATWFRDNREVRAFPTVAECRKTCERMPNEQAIAVARIYAKREEDGVQDRRIQRERELAAWKLCRSGMGREADRDGWLPALIEFCEDHGRLPTNAEIGRVQDKSRRSEASLAAMEPDKDAADYRGKLAMFNACRHWRKVMLDRAHDNVFGWLERHSSPSSTHPATDRAA